MKQNQRLATEDIYLTVKSNRLDYARSRYLANRQKKAAGRFQTLAEQREAKYQRALQFAQLIDAWDVPVCQALDQLAKLRWPPNYVLGLIPVSVYRLRDQQINEAHLWWVEHDISAQDKPQCAAYQVYLILDEQEQPILSVLTGAGVYPIIPLTREKLRATVATAGQDPPRIIPQNMGQ